MFDDGDVPFGPVSPASEWDRDATKRALDELFSLAGKYKATEGYRKLLQFVGRFRLYSPFNAMLVHIQLPGATYVATPSRWLRGYGHRIKPEGRPLVILQPRGPVLFVFDVSDTEAREGARPLPPEVEKPFEVRHGAVGGELQYVIDNSVRDGVRIAARAAGSQSAGQIGVVDPLSTTELPFLIRKRPEPAYESVRIRYELLFNANHSPAARYATLAHELAHLYCGHLGTPNPEWWPDRRGLSEDVREFEAESVCYLICARLGIDNPSEQYLANYAGSETPPISLDCVLKAGGLIEQMGKGRMGLRPKKKNGPTDVR
jgi:hypothetical protein